MEEKQSGPVFNLAQAINPVYAHEGNKGDNELVIKAQVSLLESLIELWNDFSWVSRLGKSAQQKNKRKNHGVRLRRDISFALKERCSSTEQNYPRTFF